MYLNFDIGVTLRWQLYINALLIVFVFVHWFFCPDSFTSTLCRRRQKLKSLCNISNSSFLFCPTGSHLLKLGEFYHISSSQTEDMLGKSKKMATLHQTGFTIKIMNHVPILVILILIFSFFLKHIWWVSLAVHKYIGLATTPNDLTFCFFFSSFDFCVEYCVDFFVEFCASQIYWPSHHPKWPHQTVFLSRCAVIYITLWGIHSQPNIAFTVREAAN